MKFWSSLNYFLKIKQKFSITFYSKTDNQIERQNNTIKAYLRAFISYKQNNLAKLILMTEFIYNNTKIASNSHTFFKVNCGYHICIFYKKNIYSYSIFKWIDKLITKSQKLITMYTKNFYYTLKLQKLAHNKIIKSKSYVFENKVLLNSKYIKTKQNHKLKAKF